MRTMIAAAAFVAAMGCNIPSGYAFGDAPWCAVKNFGSDVVWDCEYRTVVKFATSNLLPEKHIADCKRRVNAIVQGHLA
jgi:hypothetical protein